MVSKRLLLTASHVFKFCKKGEVRFERIDPHSSVYKMTEVIFNLEPGTFFLPHPDSTLDVALIAVSEKSHDGKSRLSDVGYCKRVISSERPGTRVNIIQFPQNSNQMVVLRQNQILHSDERFLKIFDNAFVEHHRYKVHHDAAKKRSWFSSSKKDNCSYNLPFFRYNADTQAGSSGSPCFDDMWNLTGIHHCALRVDNEQRPGVFKYIANEGVKIDVIIEWAKNELGENSSYNRELLGELFGGNL
ncbi:hypothetical protein OS493_012797 [Desmophyllum pertusum]|uniref:Uncharacterized protein n=1 Tax=Desmophyllum pertusum TaxID=174260 RepID=A0A9W9ZEV2_9CNID|nr:hypothetical protein OS493_012797 [Desmophyllum pertusum]